MKTITFELLLDINGAINNLFAEPTFANTKFGYACKKFVQKNVVKPIADYDEEIMLCRVNNALTDEKTGELLQDEKGNYKFNKEGTIAFMQQSKEIRAKWLAKEVEIEPYIVTDLPELTDEQTELFKGVFFE